MNGNGATGDDACHLRLTADGNVGESNGEDVEILLVMIVLMIMMVMVMMMMVMMSLMMAMVL